MTLKHLTVQGISFPTALFLVFLVLKLCSVIAWSWWWVFSPLWLPIVITFGVPLILVGACLAAIGVCIPIAAVVFVVWCLYKLCKK